ncbi:unnamed protein product [Bathycoccus prasinos]
MQSTVFISTTSEQRAEENGYADNDQKTPPIGLGQLLRMFLEQEDKDEMEGKSTPPEQRRFRESKYLSRQHSRNHPRKK